MRRRLVAMLRNPGGSLWRDERGEIVSAVLLGAKGVILVMAALLPFMAAVDEVNVSTCIDRITKASETLAQKYPGNAPVPPDDINVQEINNCKDFARRLAQQSNNSAAAKNLSKLADEGLKNLGQCSLDIVSPASPVAGLTGSIFISAIIPFAGSGTNVTGTVTLPRGGQFSASLNRTHSGAIGSVGIPTNQSDKVGGEAGTVAFTATSVVAKLSDGTCAPPSKDQGGQCVVSCTATQNVIWNVPKAPDIKLFLVAPPEMDKNDPKPVVLAWNVHDATQVTIDQGVGEVAEIGTSFELPPDQDTTYTLTAVGVRPQDTRTATQTVKVKDTSPFTVSITSPGGNSQTTSSLVAVQGKVTPAPGKILNGTITVNGGLGVPVSVDAAGNFGPTSVLLTRVVGFSDLGINNPDLGVATCGDRSVPVTVTNGQNLSGVTNTIAVTVTDGTRQASAAVTVSHAVRLTSFRVDWAPGCPPLNKNQTLSTVLAPGQTVTVGTVDCGCKGSSNGCHGACGVRAAVGTSLGETLQRDSTWTFNVAGPCP